MAQVTCLLIADGFQHSFSPGEVFGLTFAVWHLHFGSRARIISPADLSSTQEIEAITSSTLDLAAEIMEEGT
jgi:hypothetical protein